MPELSDTVATPDGIDFAYQLAAEKLSSQLDIIDRLDAKVGALAIYSHRQISDRVPRLGESS
jgi:hypothetical protein